MINNINGSTKITGIFGYPIKHTLSPAMHNAAFKNLGLNYIYVPFEIKPENLKTAVKSILSLNIKGVNVTFPYKQKVMKFLDEIDPLAASIGSVNTIVNCDGKLKGYNTDGTGFLKDIKNYGFNPAGKTAVLVGAGGAGRAVACILAANGIKKIYITDRTKKTAAELSKNISNAEYIPLENWKSKLNETNILINTTPVGMHDGDKAYISSSEINKNLFIYDVIYNRKTELLIEAQKAKAKAYNGLGMLLYQGATAFELWTNTNAPIEIMRKTLLKEIKKG